MKKIILVGPYFFKNFGDPLYTETTKKAIQKFTNADVEILDLYGRLLFELEQR